MHLIVHACYRGGVVRRGGADHPAPLRKEDVRSVEQKSGREFMNDRIVRNLIWMLVIFAVPAAILILLAFVEGFPLRMLIVIVILVPVMGVLVTALTLHSGKRRTGRGSGNYSDHTYYPVGVPEGGAGDLNREGHFDREGLFGGGDFGGRGDSGGGWSVDQPPRSISIHRSAWRDCLESRCAGRMARSLAARSAQKGTISHRCAG